MTSALLDTLSFTEEECMIRDMAADFAKSEVAPIAIEIAAMGRTSTSANRITGIIGGQVASFCTCRKPPSIRRSSHVRLRR